ncbi:hypothetical protein, partial [Proteus mirabilis]
LFLSRPGFDETKVLPVPKAAAAAAGGTTNTAAQGKLVCTLVPERSRVIVSPTDRVDLDIGEDGCING